MRTVATLFALLLCRPVDGKHIKYEGRHCQGSVRHVHISVGPDPSTSMTVSFSSTSSENETPHGAVLIGTQPDQLHRVVLESEPPLSYNSTARRPAGPYFSPYQHHITIDGLEPETKYFYQCIARSRLSELEELQGLGKESPSLRGKNTKEDFPLGEEEEKLEESEDESRQRKLGPTPYDPSRHGTCPNPNAVRKFHTAPSPGEDIQVKFSIVGDLGQFEQSINTLRHLRKHHHHNVNAMLLAGDIAYTEINPQRWDTFFDFMDDLPYIDEIPLMICPGNHDIDKPEHEQDIFRAFEHRFRMPRIAPPILEPYDGPDGNMPMSDVPYPLPYNYGNAYYDFVYGPSHHIMLNSYAAIEPGSMQYEWLQDTLAAVDRTITPWLFVTFHCPFYNTFFKHQYDKQAVAMREHVEPLLVESKVNLVFTGHVHAYMRTKNVAYRNVTATGPAYIVVGAGGRDAKAAFLHEEPEEWVAVRDSTLYGYGSLEIFNRTHARWDWIHTGTEGVDHNEVWKSDVELPPGGTDHVYIHNQFYIEEADRGEDFVYEEDPIEDDQIGLEDDGI